MTALVASENKNNGFPSDHAQKTIFIPVPRESKIKTLLKSLAAYRLSVRRIAAAALSMRSLFSIFPLKSVFATALLSENAPRSSQRQRFDNFLFQTIQKGSEYTSLPFFFRAGARFGIRCRLLKIFILNRGNFAHGFFHQFFDLFQPKSRAGIAGHLPTASR